MVEDGVVDLSAPSYQATTTLADVVAVPVQGGVNYVLLFEFKEQVGSLTRNIEINVDSPIYIEITADENLDPENCSISLVGGYSYSAPYMNTYYSYTDASGNLRLSSYNTLGLELTDGTPCYINGIFVQTDATFGWIFEENDDYAFEARGLWEMKNDAMGGPFVSHVRVDRAHARVVVVEGFVYNPGGLKRDKMRKLNAALYTLQLPSVKDVSEIPVDSTVAEEKMERKAE